MGKPFQEKRVGSCVHEANGIREYIKEVWEESKYTKSLEITRRFTNDENIMASKKGQVGEAEAFSTICSFFGDEEYGPRVIDEAAVEGESGSGEKFYDAEDKDQGSPEVQEEIQRLTHKVRLDERIRPLQESTPRVLLAEFQKLNC
ncbi:hypothetical protein Dimus_035517 [Dionaea muscipula]